MSWGDGGGGGGVPASEVILATAHGFTVGTPPGPIARVGGVWVAARANNAVNAEVQAWLEAVVDVNHLQIVEVSGASITLPALDAAGAAVVAGEAYFVSILAPAVGAAGLLQRLTPIVAGQISKPILLTRLDGDGALVGRLQQFRAATVGVETIGPFNLYRINLNPGLGPVFADFIDAKTLDGGATAALVAATPRLVSGNPGAVGFQAVDDAVLSVQGIVLDTIEEGVDGYFAVRLEFGREVLPAATTNGQAAYAVFCASGGPALPDISLATHRLAGVAFVIDSEATRLLNTAGQTTGWQNVNGAAFLNDWRGIHSTTAIFHRVGTTLNTYVFADDSTKAMPFTAGAPIVDAGIAGRGVVGISTRHANVGSAGIAYMTGYRQWTDGEPAPWSLLV